MADRTFHKRFMVSAKCGIVFFTLLAGYFFWVKMAIIGILLAIVIVGMMERILHTAYTFRRVVPIDRDEEMDFLVVDEGRFSSNRTVPVCDIIHVERVSCFFGLDHALVIEYGAHRLLTVVPDNEERFLKEIKVRQEASIEDKKKKDFEYDKIDEICIGLGAAPGYGEHACFCPSGGRKCRHGKRR